MCGADFPLKVSALGEGSALGYVDEAMRPPGTFRRGPPAPQPNWPIRAALSAAAQAAPNYAQPGAPMSLDPPAPQYGPPQQKQFGAPASNLQAPPAGRRGAAPPAEPERGRR